MKKFERSLFPERGVQFEDLEASLRKCSEYQKPFRAKANSIDKINMTILVIGLIAAVIGAMVLGLYSNWGYAILAIIIYVIFGWIVNKIAKYYTNKYLKQGHFMLALLCRCEANRLYLQHNIEMRAGFMGKWIEFVTHDISITHEQIIDVMYER